LVTDQQDASLGFFKIGDRTARAEIPAVSEK